MSTPNEIRVTPSFASHEIKARPSFSPTGITARARIVNKTVGGGDSDCSRKIALTDDWVEAVNYMAIDLTPKMFKLTIPQASIGTNQTIKIGTSWLRDIVEQKTGLDGNSYDAAGAVYYPFIQIGSTYYSPFDWRVNGDWITIDLATVPPYSADLTVYLIEIPCGDGPIDLADGHTVLTFSNPASEV